MEAVVNCTTAGTTLRSFLQSSTDLTVDVLLDILRSYFAEADTVELLQRLATAHQSPKEDPQTFLIALLDLKNRIVRNEDDGIGFSPETVMKITLKALETGFLSWKTWLDHFKKPCISALPQLFFPGGIPVNKDCSPLIPVDLRRILLPADMEISL